LEGLVHEVDKETLAKKKEKSGKALEIKVCYNIHRNKQLFFQIALI